MREVESFRCNASYPSTNNVSVLNSGSAVDILHSLWIKTQSQFDSCRHCGACDFGAPRKEEVYNFRYVQEVVRNAWAILKRN